MAPSWDRRSMVGFGFGTAPPSLGKRFVLGTVCLAVATLFWLPTVHRFFRSDSGEYYRDRTIPPRADKLANRHLRLWGDAAVRARGLQRMRAANPEWDFMGRTFLVLSLANMTLREPSTKSAHLEVIDQIIADTLRLERDHGPYHFLLQYARAKPFVVQPPRSLFIDSEIALVLAARRMLAERPEYRDRLTERVQSMLARMEKSPLLSAESYPDECWMFDHACALAAIRLADFLDGSDHTSFFRRWINMAQENLTDPQTGLLISSFTWSGAVRDGPEGSSIWLVAHCLELIDRGFAADQYARARKELSRTTCGFGYAREWPASWRSPGDVDSGPVIPVLDISPGASGMAIVGASAFRDHAYLSTLFTTLDFAAFPLEDNGSLKYCASNQVGDAVILYATVLGPLWEKVTTERRP